MAWKIKITEEAQKDFSKIEPLTDKKTFYEVCAANGIDFPATNFYHKIEHFLFIS